MFRNYITIAFRNFWRNKVFSFINVLGLSIGISAALVIYLIVHYDFSFEKFQNDGDRIYRVVTDMKFGEDDFKNSGVPYPLPAAVREEVRGLEESSAFYTYGGKVQIPSPGGAHVFKKQGNIVFADDHYFKLFSFYRWLAGSPQGALKEPFQVVLSESRARTYFPSQEMNAVIGKQVIYNDSVPATVTGIVKDLDETTDFTFKEFISEPTVRSSGLKANMGVDSWGSTNSASQFFVKLSPQITPHQVEAAIMAVRKKYDKEPVGTVSTPVRHHLQTLRDIHFNRDYDNFDQRVASKSTLYGLTAVGIFLLLLGCINFINLATAQAVQRAKEIGIRKTVGSSRSQLMFQFLTETCLLTLVATLFSLALTPWLLHIFSDFIPAGLHLDFSEQQHLIPFLAVLVIVVSLLSGFYPGLVLSRFQPVWVMKNQVHTTAGQNRRSWLRKTLTISQFVIAQVFIMATMMVEKQIYFSLHKDLGYKKEAIITLPTPYRYNVKDGSRFVLADKIRSIPGVEKVSVSGSSPASFSYSTSMIHYSDGKTDKETDVQIKQVDTNYLSLYHLKLVAGRNLQQSDTTREYLINEAYARALGFKDPADAIGQVLTVNKVPIVGVLADFHPRSLRETIKPLAMSSEMDNQYTVHIALQPQKTAGTTWKSAIEKIEKTWKQFYPEEDFTYEFYDQTIARFYKSEQDISRLLKWATGLVILISCLGLLGLVMYTINTRTKEIGVRKVLGASVAQVVATLSKDFIRLVVIAFLIAIPLAWWAMHKWLENFAYRTSISLWIFLLTGLVMLLLAFITLGFQTAKAAMANPVNSLRSE